MTKILTVDEDTDVLRLLRIKLGAAGYEVVRARDGQEALAAAQPEDDAAPDMIITELLLPDVDGVALLARLAALPSAPVLIALSARTDHATIAAALAAGAADYVTKPFSPQALLERIRLNLIRAGRLDAAPMEA
jgi:two-component system KDP operon response regulator KdpE